MPIGGVESLVQNSRYRRKRTLVRLRRAEAKMITHSDREGKEA